VNRAPRTALAVVALAVACTSGNGSLDAGPDAGPEACLLGADGGAQSVAPAPYDGGCPSSPPAAGSTCPTLGLSCTWGSDPRIACRASATCLGPPAVAPSWSVAQDHCSPLAACCPATPPTQDDPCDSASLNGLACVYSGSVYSCGCVPPEMENVPLTWCLIGNYPGCPSVVPNLGTECDSPGLNCVYNYCTTPEIAIECFEGTWQPGGGRLCPR
jgi:hypothetical protein